MRILFQTLILLFFGVALSCSMNTQEKRVDNAPQKLKVVPNQILVVEVEGMVCKMGCGGLMRRELIETNAVSRVEIEYQEGVERQTIKIHFDDKLISQTEIVKKLEEINKNQFKVYPIGSTEIVSLSSDSPSNSSLNIREISMRSTNSRGILSSFVSE